MVQMFSVHISVLSRVELHKKLKKSIRFVTLVDQLNQFIFATSKTSVHYAYQLGGYISGKSTKVGTSRPNLMENSSK